MVDIIEQGETYSFEVSATSATVDSTLALSVNVLQYPGDTPAITKSITPEGGLYKGILTSAETAALAIGQWFIHTNFTDDDEDIREPIKLYISKGWI